MKKYLELFLQKYSSLFKDGGINSWSMMRYLSWFTDTIIMITWSILCLHDHKFYDIPFGVVAVIGFAFGFKVWQRKIEGNQIEAAETIETKEVKKDEVKTTII
jgi:hypothetical protein